jgi:CMP/dCMP kinase
VCFLVIFCILYIIDNNSGKVKRKSKNKFMIISLSGAPGSGKSTIAQLLSDKLGWQRYYIGRIWREMASKHGVDVKEYSKLNESSPNKDREVDEYQRELGKNEDNFIIEGRTSWYFIPQSFKIYLYVEPEEGAKRIFGSLQKKNNRNEGENLATWQDVLASNKERMASDNGRYLKYYGIDVNDKKNFDFYLDTTNLTPEQVFSEVLKWVEERLDNTKN